MSDRVVIVAIDESETSQHAFEWAVKNILKPEDHLRLIHVQPFHEVQDIVSSMPVAMPIYSAGKVRQQSIDCARLYADMCANMGIKDYKEDIILEDGSAGAAICEYVDNMAKITSDMTLVLGSRELGFFGRAFIGSTSEHCVRHCACPVAVVKLPVKPKSA